MFDLYCVFRVHRWPACPVKRVEAAVNDDEDEPKHSQPVTFNNVSANQKSSVYHVLASTRHAL